MKRREKDEAPFSLDAFLDIVTNVVGVLVLVAIVTVLAAREISVPSGATATTAPQPSAQRVLFECVGGRIHFVDEGGNARRVLELTSDGGLALDQLIEQLEQRDVGDETYRVRASKTDDGIAWTYELRSEARGEGVADLERADSALRQRLASTEGGFAYFVVHDDSFEVFRKAREIARERGVSVGWHPVEGSASLQLAVNGSLGRRIQL